MNIDLEIVEKIVAQHLRKFRIDVHPREVFREPRGYYVGSSRIIDAQPQRCPERIQLAKLQDDRKLQRFATFASPEFSENFKAHLRYVNVLQDENNPRNHAIPLLNTKLQGFDSNFSKYEQLVVSLANKLVTNLHEPEEWAQFVLVAEIETQ